MEKIRIRRAEQEDIGRICRMIHLIDEAMENPDYFFADDDSFVERHVGKEGFILLAESGAEPVGYLVIRFPGQAQDNLLRDLYEHNRKAFDTCVGERWDAGDGEFPGSCGIDRMNLVAHFESAGVLPAYRGRGIQKQLTRTALEWLRDMPYAYYLATVHPENGASLAGMTGCGFEIAATTFKYGGLVRHILFRHKNP